MDLRDKISKHNYLLLKSRIKANAAAGKYLRLAAEANKGDTRYILRDKKRIQGYESRIAHLAYCFLRGKKHSEVESNALPAEVPSTETIKKFLIGYVDYWKYCKNGLIDKDLEAFFDSKEEKKEEAA